MLTRKYVSEDEVKLLSLKLGQRIEVHTASGTHKGKVAGYDIRGTTCRVFYERDSDKKVVRHYVGQVVIPSKEKP